MLSIKKFRQIALSFPGTEELPHFEKTSFRVKKKIFATLDEMHQKQHSNSLQLINLCFV
jgi:predicted DNA-binding protein (MmcQ/YjbR family)